MKVIELKLRTPGIFLKRPDPSQGISVPVLTLEIEQGEGNWVPIEDVDDIKVLKNRVPTQELYVTQEVLVTGSADVPLQGEGVNYVHLLVPDGKTWNYRITAKPCVDCVKVFRSYNMDDRINGSEVVVALGTISSQVE